MFDPPPQLHTGFDAAMAACAGRWAPSTPSTSDGADRHAKQSVETHNPANQRQMLGRFGRATRRMSMRRCRRRSGRGPSGAATPRLACSCCRRVGQLIGERVYEMAAALTLETGKNRMEALGEVQETADFFQGYCN